MMQLHKFWFGIWSAPTLMIGVLVVGVGRIFKWGGEGVEAAGRYMIDMCAAAVGLPRLKRNQEGDE